MTEESPPTSIMKKFMVQHGHFPMEEGEILVNGAETTRPAGWDDMAKVLAKGLSCSKIS